MRLDLSPRPRLPAFRGHVPLEKIIEVTTATTISLALFHFRPLFVFPFPIQVPLEKIIELPEAVPVAIPIDTSHPILVEVPQGVPVAVPVRTINVPVEVFWLLCCLPSSSGCCASLVFLFFFLFVSLFMTFLLSCGGDSHLEL